MTPRLAIEMVVVAALLTALWLARTEVSTLSANLDTAHADIIKQNAAIDAMAADSQRRSGAATAAALRTLRQAESARHAIDTAESGPASMNEWLMETFGNAP